MKEYPTPSSLSELLELFQTEPALDLLFNKVIEAGYVYTDLFLKGRLPTDKEMLKASQNLEVIVEKPQSSQNVADILGMEVDVKSAYEKLFTEKGVVFADTTLSALLIQLIQKEGDAATAKRLLNEANPTPRSMRKREEVQVFPPPSTNGTDTQARGRELREDEILHSLSHRLNEAIRNKLDTLEMYFLPADIDLDSHWSMFGKDVAMTIKRRYDGVSKHFGHEGRMPKTFVLLFDEFMGRAKALSAEALNQTELTAPFDAALDNFLKYVISPKHVVEVVEARGQFKNQGYGYVNKLRRQFDKIMTWQNSTSPAKRS